MLALVSIGSMEAQTNLSSGLVLCMPFSGNANDLSGKSNHGTVSGATLTTDRFNSPNSAYAFNGTSDFITVQGSTSLDSIEIKSELTISVWCKVQNWYQGWNVFPLLNKYNATSDFGWSYELQAPVGCNGQLFLPNYPLNSSACDFSVPDTTNFGQWNHYAMTYSKSGNIFKAYKNGVLVNSIPNNSLSLENTQNGLLYIGYSPAGTNEYADGAIDDIRMYSRALNAGEIALLYSGSICEPEFTDIERYNFNATTLSVYPNPTNGELNIEALREAECTIKNALGQIILQQHLRMGQNRIELHEQREGIYFVQIEGTNKIFKLIKE